jgi:RNA polymerase sigma factor (TIGR02999 family)
LPGDSVDGLTRLLGEAAGGDACAAGELLPLVYDSLKEIARQRMASERADHTLQPTALVHECYLRLFGDNSLRFAGRAQFFHAAAEAMRRILVDHARSRACAKRGGARRRVPVNLLDLAAEPAGEDVLAFDGALTVLEKESPSTAEVVRLRFFAGLSVAETAEALGVSTRSINREWAFARAWLYAALEEGDEDDGPNGNRNGNSNGNGQGNGHEHESPAGPA